MRVNECKSPDLSTIRYNLGSHLKESVCHEENYLESGD